MLVVLYLVDAKKHIIVPQEWVMALDQEVLNNNGKNCNQNRLVYWSSVGINKDDMTPIDVAIVPNFSSPISTCFPPPSDTIGTCYIARIKRFCASVEKAKHFRDYFRPKMPVLYNPARERETPIPQTTPTNEKHVLEEPNDEYPYENNDVVDDQRQEEETQNVSDESDGLIQEQNDEIESKPELPLPNVVLNESDTLAVANMFDDESDSLSEENEEIEVTENEETFYENGVLKVLRKYKSLEMIYTYGENPVPMPPGRFVVKQNDIISKNYPFEENENGDRCYSVQVGDKFKEVTLSIRVINGLKDLNGDVKRDNVSKDKAFVKALLVGLIGVTSIKNGDVDKYVVRFIKEIFSYRVQENDSNAPRYLAFDKLRDCALDEIRKDIYTTKRV